MWNYSSLSCIFLWYYLRTFCSKPLMSFLLWRKMWYTGLGWKPCGKYRRRFICAHFTGGRWHIVSCECVNKSTIITFSRHRLQFSSARARFPASAWTQTGNDSLKMPVCWAQSSLLKKTDVATFVACWIGLLTQKVSSWRTGIKSKSSQSYLNCLICLT